MKKRTQDDVIAILTSVCVYLAKKSVDDYARLEALRDVLQQQGVVSEAQFDAHYARLSAAGQQAWMESSLAESLRALLQTTPPEKPH